MPNVGIIWRSFCLLSPFIIITPLTIHNQQGMAATLVQTSVAATYPGDQDEAQGHGALTLEGWSSTPAAIDSVGAGRGDARGNAGLASGSGYIPHSDGTAPLPLPPTVVSVPWIPTRFGLELGSSTYIYGSHTTHCDIQCTINTTRVCEKAPMADPFSSIRNTHCILPYDVSELLRMADAHTGKLGGNGKQTPLEVQKQIACRSRKNKLLRYERRAFFKRLKALRGGRFRIETHAATLIQAAYRGHRGRWRVRAIRSDVDPQEALEHRIQQRRIERGLIPEGPLTRLERGLREADALQQASRELHVLAYQLGLPPIEGYTLNQRLNTPHMPATSPLAAAGAGPWAAVALHSGRRRRQDMLVAAATAITKVVRGYLARKAMQRVIEKAVEQHIHNVCVRVQRKWRRFRIRRDRWMELQVGLRRAATKIQTRFRMYRAKKQMFIRRKIAAFEKRQQDAALVIQHKMKSTFHHHRGDSSPRALLATHGGERTVQKGSGAATTTLHNSTARSGSKRDVERVGSKTVSHGRATGQGMASTQPHMAHTVDNDVEGLGDRSLPMAMAEAAATTDVSTAKQSMELSGSLSGGMHDTSTFSVQSEASSVSGDGRAQEDVTPARASMAFTSSLVIADEDVSLRALEAQLSPQPYTEGQDAAAKLNNDQGVSEPHASRRYGTENEVTTGEHLESAAASSASESRSSAAHVSQGVAGEIQQEGSGESTDHGYNVGYDTSTFASHEESVQSVETGAGSATGNGEAMERQVMLMGGRGQEKVKTGATRAYHRSRIDVGLLEVPDATVQEEHNTPASAEHASK